MNKVALAYFLKNWDPIRTQWTCFAENSGTLGSKTNNRCESMNQKLKQHIRLLSKLPEAIKDFFIWKNFHQNENKKKIVSNFGTTLPSCNTEYQKILLDKVLRLIMEELESSSFISFDTAVNNTLIKNMDISNDKTKLLKNKVECLECLRDACLADKAIYVAERKKKELEATKLLEGEALVLPRSGKMIGRPKKALITTVKFKKQSKEKNDQPTYNV